MARPASYEPAARVRGTAAADLPNRDKAVATEAAGRVRKPGSAPLPLERPLCSGASLRKTDRRHVSDQPTVQSPRAQPLLDIPAVAARLGVSSKTVRRHIDRGDLAVHHIGRLLRVSEEDLASFVARRRQIQSKNNV